MLHNEEPGGDIDRSLGEIYIPAGDTQLLVCFTQQSIIVQNAHFLGFCDVPATAARPGAEGLPQYVLTAGFLVILVFYCNGR